MTVEPSNRSRNTTEDDTMSNILPNLVLIETLIGCTMQLGEHLVQTICDRLALTFIDIGSQTNAQNGNHRRSSSNLCIEVDGIVCSLGRNKRAETSTPSCKTGNGGVDTNTHCDNTKYNQRSSHCERSLMWCMMCMSFLILCTPEDTVVQAEHIESSHCSNTGHNPTYYRTIGEASGDNLIL